MTENTLYSQNNNGFIRPIVKSQLLMELKTENFAINENIINLSENYLLTEYSKELDQTILNNFSKLINMDENSFIELIESIDE